MKVLVIDPTSSGRDLVTALRTYPHVEVSVHWQVKPLEVDTPHSFDAKALDGFADIASRRYDVILAGSEKAVTAADGISHALGLPSNRPETMNRVVFDGG